MKKIFYGLVFVLLASFIYLFITTPYEEEVANDELAPSEVFVYETEVENKNECVSFEKYDSKRKVCSFECADENECADLNRQAQDEFASWADELEKEAAPVAEKNIKNDDTSEKATYKVLSGEKITFLNGDDTQEYRKIWDDIKDLSPDSLSDKYIEEFQVFDNESDDTLAFVDDADGNGKWRIAVNLSSHKSSSLREQKSTLIHELAHIISLNGSQVSDDDKKCNTLKLDEGCTKSDSYINTFYQAFWKNIKNKDSVKFDKNKYVTDYATTNEVEDFAESFTFFVLEKNLEDTENTLRDQKIKSFYNFTELVDIRSDMRKQLSKDVIRAKKAISYK